MTARRIVFIGAAGEMCRVAVERFASAGGDWQLTLTDIRPERLEPLLGRLPRASATAQRLDLFDRVSLLEVIDGAALVVLGAGPYTRTSEPVLTACLEAGVPYLDFDDDVESTQAALALGSRAREAGVPCYVGCGASPGMTNVLAVDAAGDLDTVHGIDMCWVVGDERPGIGRAVLEHLLHIAAGPCLTWANGGPAMHRTWVETDIVPMGGSLGDLLLYETAHPEAVTVPRRYPDANRIRVLGGLDPAPFNGLARGLGLAVQRGAMTVEQAVDFMVDLLENRLGAVTGWRHALAGMAGQIRRGESTTPELLRFLVAAALRRPFPYRAGLMARAIGIRDGQPTVAIRRTPVSGPDAHLLRDMAAVTGTSCAAFMTVALEVGSARVGVLAPEDWVDPPDFYAALERVGTPRAEIVESLTSPAVAPMA